jgi:hypothetical protein
MSGKGFVESDNLYFTVNSNTYTLSNYIDEVSLKKIKCKFSGNFRLKAIIYDNSSSKEPDGRLYVYKNGTEYTVLQGHLYENRNTTRDVDVFVQRGDIIEFVFKRIRDGETNNSTLKKVGIYADVIDLSGIEVIS